MKKSYQSPSARIVPSADIVCLSLNKACDDITLFTWWLTQEGEFEYPLDFIPGVTTAQEIHDWLAQASIWGISGDYWASTFVIEEVDGKVICGSNQQMQE